MTFLLITKTGVRLKLKVRPGSAREEICGAIDLGNDDGVALAVALKAPPHEGKANKALISFLADCFEIKKSALSIQSGASGRVKLVAIAGDPETLSKKIARACVQRKPVK
jgi:hypothetical protein